MKNYKEIMIDMRNLMKGHQIIYLNRKDVKNKENLIIMNKKYKNQL
jgi:hypothetical protein